MSGSAGGVGLGAGGGRDGIRASGAYRTYQFAVEQLAQNAVVERLGDPLRPGWPSRLGFQGAIGIGKRQGLSGGIR
ncbi:hypothetical protein NW863_10010 [Synechococcus sp. B60.1]|uniref:hypothetical protein n=1 Tax=Synechococcus sp. B60.1 TaxID=2964522 RepID=UPI0039C12D32